MLLNTDTFSMLDDILIRIGSKLQLDDTRRTLAEERYKSVAGFLKDSEKFGSFDLDIYPHGSFRIGTSTKPILNDEYDLDFILEFESEPYTNDPNKVLIDLHSTLNENGNYKGKLSFHKRSVRINYANEFHMDIVPGFAIYRDSNMILVPDRKLLTWKDSNPKGYAEFFEGKYIFEKSLLEKAFNIEELPDQEDYTRLQPLQKGVQLIKRYRDIYFMERKIEEKYRTKSIILTTLAAHAYQGEYSESMLLSNILSFIENLIVSNHYYPFELSNPANEGEKFSEQWNNTDTYKYFIDFIGDFKTKWDSVIETEGIHNLQPKLISLFGETLSKNAIREQGIAFNKKKDNEEIFMDKNIGYLVSQKSENTIKHNKKHDFGGNKI